MKWMKSAAICMCAGLLAANCLHAQVKGKRPAITGLSHVVVLNDDLDASSKFYAGLVGWPATPALEDGDAVHYQVGAQQYIEVKKAPGPKDPVDRLDHIAFITADVKAMREYLGLNGVAVPAKVTVRKDGGSSFMVTDPEGYAIEFVQGGKFPPTSTDAVSTRLMHVGFSVRNEALESHFYIDLLGFRLYWEGWNKDEGHKDGVYDYKSLQVPDGTDWVEFMLSLGRNQQPGQPWMRDPHHFAPGVVSIEDSFVLLQKRGLADRNEPRSKPQLGRDGKMQLNLFDPNGLRVELMGFEPVQDPCCYQFTGPQPSPER